MTLRPVQVGPRESGARPGGLGHLVHARRCQTGVRPEEDRGRNQKKKTKFTRLPPWPLADAFATGYWGKDGRGETPSPLSIFGARDGKQSFRITLYMRATLSAKVSPSPYCLLVANQACFPSGLGFPGTALLCRLPCRVPAFRFAASFSQLVTVNARRVSHLPHFSFVDGVP